MRRRPTGGVVIALVVLLSAALQIGGVAYVNQLGDGIDPSTSAIDVTVYPAGPRGYATDPSGIISDARWQVRVHHRVHNLGLMRVAERLRVEPNGRREQLSNTRSKPPAWIGIDAPPTAIERWGGSQHFFIGYGWPFTFAVADYDSYLVLRQRQGAASATFDSLSAARIAPPLPRIPPNRYYFWPLLANILIVAALLLSPGAAIVALKALVRARLRAHRLKRNRCPTCAYPLLATGRCPECGETTPAAAPTRAAPAA